MTAKFHAIGTIAIPAKQYFVIFGDILDGTIKPGMSAGIAFNSSIRFTAPVYSVEMVDGANGSHIALVFTASDDNELELWKALNIGDEIVEITEGS